MATDEDEFVTARANVDSSKQRADSAPGMVPGSLTAAESYRANYPSKTKEQNFFAQPILSVAAAPKISESSADMTDNSYSNFSNTSTVDEMPVGILKKQSVFGKHPPTSSDESSSVEPFRQQSVLKRTMPQLLDNQSDQETTTEKSRRRSIQSLEGRAELGATEEWKLKEEPFCLCGLMRTTSAAIAIGICEFFIMCHSLIFTYSNFFAGPDKYNHYNPVFAHVIKYPYLLPFLIIQMVWLIANLILVVGVKTSRHLMVIPRLIVQAIGMLTLVALCVAAFVNLGVTETDPNWELIVSLCFCVTIILFEIYFFRVVWQCYQFLKHTRAVVRHEKMWLRPISAFFDSSRPQSTIRPLGTLTQNRPPHGRTGNRPSF